MKMQDHPITHSKLGDLRILLSGVPGTTSRGYLGYCTIVLFPLNGAWALFDTGHYSDRHLLLGVLEKIQISPKEIRHVVLSHLHFDHSLNLGLFKEATIYVSQAELDYAGRVLTGKLEDSSVPDIWPLLLKDRRIELVEEALNLSPSIRLLKFPGHTPGCLAMFYDGPSIVAVCGDIIKNAWEAVSGESKMASGGGECARSSIKTLKEKAEIIIPGHDRPFVWQGEGVEFISPFVFEVRTDLYPEEQDKSALSIQLKAGFSGTPAGASGI